VARAGSSELNASSHPPPGDPAARAGPSGLNAPPHPPPGNRRIQPSGTDSRLLHTFHARPGVGSRAIARLRIHVEHVAPANADDRERRSAPQLSESGCARRDYHVVPQQRAVDEIEHSECARSPGPRAGRVTGRQPVGTVLRGGSPVGLTVPRRTRIFRCGDPRVGHGPFATRSRQCQRGSAVTRARERQQQSARRLRLIVRNVAITPATAYTAARHPVDVGTSSAIRVPTLERRSTCPAASTRPGRAFHVEPPEPRGPHHHERLTRRAADSVCGSVGARLVRALHASPDPSSISAVLRPETRRRSVIVVARCAPDRRRVPRGTCERTQSRINGERKGVRPALRHAHLLSRA